MRYSRMLAVRATPTRQLEFLGRYKSDREIFSLGSDAQISIRKYFLTFDSWKGQAVPNTYGNKPVIDWNGEPVFAELAVLRLFQSNGWEGAWVDSYRKKHRIGLPDVVAPIGRPADRKSLLDSIRAKTRSFGGCWDLFLWKGDLVQFVELKRNKRDAIRDSQRNWLATALGLGLHPECFSVVEWDLSK